MAGYIVETDSGKYHVETEDAPNPVMEGAKSLASGVEQGGLGILQTAENMQKDLTHTPSKFQGIIDTAKQYLPKSKLDGTIPGELLQGAGQVPGYATQVAGLGGGVPGMAAQGYYGQNPGASQQQRNIGAGVGAALGGAYKGVNLVQAQPESGLGTKIAALLGRIGLGGALGGGVTLAQGGTPEQATASGIFGAGMSAPTEKFTTPQLQEKLSKRASEIIQPPHGEQSHSIGQGQLHPAVKQFIENLKQPSGKHEDLISQMKAPAESLMQQRDKMMTENNGPQDRAYLDGLFKAIQQAKQDKVKPTMIKGLEDVYQREVEHLNEVGGMDNFTAQTRKEFHGKQADPLLKKVSEGKPTELTPGEMQGHELLRSGLQRQLEQTNPGIDKLNEPYGGLLSAQELLADQASKSRNAPSPSAMQSFFGKILPWLVENPVYRAASIGKQIASKGSSSTLKGQTEQVIRLKDLIKRRQG